jgi:hypothetical protein
MESNVGARAEVIGFGNPYRDQKKISGDALQYWAQTKTDYRVAIEYIKHATR